MKTLLIATIFAAVAIAQPVVSMNPPLDTNYLPNAASVGTTLGQWLVMDTSGNAVNAPTTVSAGVRGLCITGCGTTGMAGFLSRGVWPGLLDNTGTVGHWVVPSPSVAGKGHDTGSTTRPTSGVIYGQVQSAASGGMYYVVLNPPDQQASTTPTVCSVEATFTGTEIANGKTAVGAAPGACTLTTAQIISDASISATFDVATVALTSWTGTGTGTSLVGSGTKPVISAATQAYGTSGQTLATGGSGYSGWTSLSVATGYGVEVTLSGVTVGSATKLTLLLTGAR